jgi:hypothetical protein
VTVRYWRTLLKRSSWYAPAPAAPPKSLHQKIYRRGCSLGVETPIFFGLGILGTADVRLFTYGRWNEMGCSEAKAPGDSGCTGPAGRLQTRNSDETIHPMDAATPPSACRAGFSWRSLVRARLDRLSWLIPPPARSSLRRHAAPLQASFGRWTCENDSNISQVYIVRSLHGSERYLCWLGLAIRGETHADSFWKRPTFSLGPSTLLSVAARG